MQVIQLPPGDMSYIIQIRNISALKDADHKVGIDDLSDGWTVSVLRARDLDNE